MVKGDGGAIIETGATEAMLDRLSDAGIRSVLAERIGGLGDSAGLVVGVLGPHYRSVIAFGHRSERDLRPLDGDTAFEIGSITKVFTALLLADMVQRGEVALADPVAKYLPTGMELPEPSGRSITLLDLVTHTAGLPFMTGEPATFTDPDAVKTWAASLHEVLARIEIPRRIGVDWEYSNIGYWLLGEALSFRAGISYEKLLRAQVLNPLRLKSTALTLSPWLEAKLAVGHDASLRPAVAISDVPMFAVMPAAGSLVSTANDLLMFLALAMGFKRSPLAPTMAAMLGSRRPTQEPSVEQALGWLVMSKGDDRLIYHDGGTFGFASSVAWDPKKQVGVVALSNLVGDVSDITRHLLRPETPLARPITTMHVEIELDFVRARCLCRPV